VLTPATAPLEPSFPKPLPKILALAAGLALVAACAAAFLLETLNRRIRTPGDLAAVLPLPVLGVLTRSARSSRLLQLPRSSPVLLAR
jgi:capsular polysaccharide biosynthesis protein